MSDKVTVQAILSDQSELDTNRVTQLFALFNDDGTVVELGVDGADGADGADATVAPVTTGSAIGTVGKTTTAIEPADNTFVPVIFTNGNSANSPTIAFNGGTARAIQLGGVASTGATLAVAAGGLVVFFFDGTVLHQLGEIV